MLNFSDEEICSMSKERKMKPNQDFSAHEKQFVYLPLAILNSATNIRQLFSQIENKKKLDALIGKIHTQMSSTHWAPELSNLRFVDSDFEPEEKANEAAAENLSNKPARRMTRSLNMLKTMQNSPRLESAKENRAAGQSKKRKVKQAELNLFLSI